MKKTIISGVLTLGLAVGFSGCAGAVGDFAGIAVASVPEPIQVSLKTPNNLTKEEQDKILSIAITATKNSSALDSYDRSNYLFANGNFGLRGDCIVQIRGKQKGGTVCYAIKDNSLITINNNTARIMDFDREDIADFSSRVARNLKVYMQDYSNLKLEFENKYNAIDKNLIEKKLVSYNIIAKRDKYYTNLVLEENPENVKQLLNKSQDIQLTQVKENGLAIQYINNPSEEIQLAAVNENLDSFKYIKNPSEKVQLTAVSKSALNIKYITNPSEEIQLAAVRKDGYVIKYINNPSEKVQLTAIKSSKLALENINQPTENAKQLSFELYQKQNKVTYSTKPELYDCSIYRGSISKFETCQARNQGIIDAYNIADHMLKNGR